LLSSYAQLPVDFPSKSQPGWLCEPSPWVDIPATFALIEVESSKMKTKRGLSTWAATSGDARLKLTKNAAADPMRVIGINL
jgi:hypothetical protein